MSVFFIYGKRTQEWRAADGTMKEPDKQFRAIDANGVRVSKLEKACPFATKEDAEEFLAEKLSKRGKLPGVKFEIRKK